VTIKIDERVLEIFYRYRRIAQNQALDLTPADPETVQEYVQGLAGILKLKPPKVRLTECPNHERPEWVDQRYEVLTEHVIMRPHIKKVSEALTHDQQVWVTLHMMDEIGVALTSVVNGRYWDRLEVRKKVLETEESRLNVAGNHMYLGAMHRQQANHVKAITEMAQAKTPQIVAAYLRFLDLNIYGANPGMKKVTVSKKPVKILLRPGTRVIHSDTEPAVVWGDGCEHYVLLGHEYKKRQWERIVTGRTKVRDVLRWKNGLAKNHALSYLGPKRVLEECRTSLISVTDRGNRLYEVHEAAPLMGLQILEYECPSTGKQYHKWAMGRHKDADHAQADRLRVTMKEYKAMIES
jgi:hypothetical protein